jgi:nitrate reductase NapAB chaperone NapD
MKPTLFLLAAGMGSRYGGLKQLDGLGPNGETIMDYSIYDAINAGFGKLVFVIRKDFEQDFREKIISKYEGHIPCELVFHKIIVYPQTERNGKTQGVASQNGIIGRIRQSSLHLFQGLDTGRGLVFIQNLHIFHTDI